MMKQLWKQCLGIFMFATMANNVWGQPYDGEQQQGSTESFMEWAADQVQQIQDAVSSLQMQLESMWSDSRGGPSAESGYERWDRQGEGRSPGGQQGRMAGRGQNAVADPLNQGSGPSIGRGAGGRGIRPPGTGRGRGGSARGTGAGRGRISGGSFPGQVQNVPSGSGRGRGVAGLTSMGSGRGRGSSGKGSWMNPSGRGKGRRRK